MKILINRSHIPAKFIVDFFKDPSFYDSLLTDMQRTDQCLIYFFEKYGHKIVVQGDPTVVEIPDATPWLVLHTQHGETLVYYEAATNRLREV